MRNISIIQVHDHSFDRKMLQVARHMRAVDYQEIIGLAGRDPAAVVQKSWEMRGRRWIIIKQVDVQSLEPEKVVHSFFVPIAVWGIAIFPGNSDIGIPWMVCTDDVIEHQTFIAKNSRRCLEEAKKGFKYLVNVISKANGLSIGWLKSCGFTVEDKYFIKEGYLKFYMECG